MAFLFELFEITLMEDELQVEIAIRAVD